MLKFPVAISFVELQYHFIFYLRA